MSDVARGKAEHLAAVQENERLRVALSKLTNGFKYPGEVCRVAREALQAPPAETDEQPVAWRLLDDKRHKPPQYFYSEQPWPAGVNAEPLYARHAQKAAEPRCKICDHIESLHRLAKVDHGFQPPAQNGSV